MANLSEYGDSTWAGEERREALVSFKGQTRERSAVSLILLKPQTVEGEVLTSDTLRPRHMRQARSAPAPPSGQQATYNQALDDAELRSSLSQLLGRLLSGKGENGASRDKVDRTSYFRLTRPVTISSRPLSALLHLSTPLPSPVTHAVSHHLPFPSRLLSPIPSPSLRPPWPRSAVTLIESALPCHVAATRLADLALLR